MQTVVILQTIVKYTDISIEANRVRLGVCPSGIKPSKFITYFKIGSNEGLQNALKECVVYLKENNKYWEEESFSSDERLQEWIENYPEYEVLEITYDTLD